MKPDLWFGYLQTSNPNIDIKRYGCWQQTHSRAAADSQSSCVLFHISQVCIDIFFSATTEMTKETCQVIILSRMCMLPRDLSHQTPTWIRNAGDHSLWWRKTPYCTATSTTRTRRCHRSAEGAPPPMVRSQPRPRWWESEWQVVPLAWRCGCVILTFIVPPSSRPAQAHLHACGIQLGGRQWRPGQAEERKQERWVGGRGRERKRKGGRERRETVRDGEWSEVSGLMSHNILTLSDLWARK